MPTWSTRSHLAGLGFVALIPITRWLAQSGQLGWMPKDHEPSSATEAVPSLKRAWPHLAVSLTFVLVSLVLTIGLVA